MDLQTAGLVFASIFAIVNPIGNLPTYVALTEGMPVRERVHIRRQIVLVGPPLLLVFMLAGTAIFQVFNITLPAFRIAGGILIFKVAFDMLQGTRGSTRWGKHEEADVEERRSIGLAPLGVPLFAGPGAITTVMILSADAIGLVGKGLVVAAVLLTYAIAYVLLKYSEAIFERLGRSGILIFSRIIGLLLAAVAVQFVIEGLRNAFPATLG